MKLTEDLLILMEEHIKIVCENFYCETKMSELLSGEEFTKMVEKARRSNDIRAMLKNLIDEKMTEIIMLHGIKQPEKTGEIWESLGFLLDRYVIENLKVWHFEEKIRIMLHNGEKDSSAYSELVRNSRTANDNRIELRKMVEHKILGILAGTEKVGTPESKMFFCQGRK